MTTMLKNQKMLLGLKFLAFLSVFVLACSATFAVALPAPVVAQEPTKVDVYSGRVDRDEEYTSMTRGNDDDMIIWDCTNVKVDFRFHAACGNHGDIKVQYDEIYRDVNIRSVDGFTYYERIERTHRHTCWQPGSWSTEDLVNRWHVPERPGVYIVDIFFRYYTYWWYNDDTGDSALYEDQWEYYIGIGMDYEEFLP